MKILKSVSISIVFVCILLFSISSLFAASVDTVWKENIDISLDNLLNVTWGSNCFIAVGTNGIVMKSENGRNWTKIKTPASGNINSILWSGDKFISATDRGEILVSADGSKWTMSIPYKSLNYGVIYKTGNRIVITSKQGYLISSLDCINWESSKTILTNIVDVEYNGKIYVAIGEGKAFKSSDGLNWTSGNFDFGTVNAITSKDGSFFAINGSVGYKDTDGYHTSTLVYTSDDGYNWSKYGELKDICNKDVIYGGKTFVFAGYYSGYYGPDDKGLISSSQDCLSYDSHGKKNANLFNKVYWNGDTYIAVGNQESISISNNGLDWENCSDSGKPIIADIASNGSIFVGTGKDGMVYTSNDGFKWSMVKPQNQALFYDVIWSGNMFYVVSSDTNSGSGVVLTSPDGVNWSSHPIYRQLKDVAWNGTLNAAVGYGDAVQICKDGWNWSGINLDEFYSRENSCIKWNGKIFVLAGDPDYIAYSSDGLIWNKTKIGQFDYIRDIEWNGNIFTAVGYNLYSGHSNKDSTFIENKKALVLTSEDGVNWTRKELDNCKQLNSVIWDGNEFVASGDNGTILASRTGSNWTVQSTDTNQSILKLEFINNRIIALTENCNILFKDGNYKHYIPEYVKKSEINYEYEWKKADIKSSAQPRVNHVAWNGSIFIATTGYDEVLTSTDGVEWQNLKVDELIRTYDVIYNGSKFILLAQGNESKRPYIYISEDGLVWEITNFETEEDVKLIAANSSAAIVWTYSPIIYKSNNLIDWTLINPPVSYPERISGIFESDGIFYMVYNGTEVYTSTDGEKWEKSNFNGPLAETVSNDVIKIFYSQFENLLYKSTDGEIWTKLHRPFEQPDNYIWNGSEFVSVSSDGRVTRSTDGILWVPDKRVEGINIIDIAWNGYTLVAVCNNGSIYYAVPKSLIKVKLNGKPLQLNNSPIIINNRTMIPFREISETCGVEVSWDEKKKTVSAVKGSSKLVLKVNNTSALLNNEEMTLDAPPVIINNRIYVPLRFISESFGFRVEWAGKTKTVEIDAN